jgi:hypothetical protein
LFGVFRFFGVFGFWCEFAGFHLLDSALGFLAELFEHDAGEGPGAAFFAVFGLGREWAEGLVGDDAVDHLDVAGGVFVLFGFGVLKVDAGDLEAVEEEAGAFGVDLVARDAGEDFADGELDGGVVFEDGQVEVWGRLGASGGFAGGVVVVAERFAAKRGAAAAVSVGEDVSALIAFHGGIPPGCTCGPKVFKKEDLSLDFGMAKSGLRSPGSCVKEESPACGRALVYFYCSEVGKTNPPSWRRKYLVSFEGVGEFSTG